ncbi:hypothetical protein BD626DRAFT_456609 [Schizophyllum amplum]|uniref:ABM domain-containing protein n=1 Tax=Schizophyllum amplum TaxID=97359 RepID=A0A550CH70_9AGAR|nr:hypothetical protein BD626DRAFT_456609 [Auriculariopsis ampla]
MPTVLQITSFAATDAYIKMYEAGGSIASVNPALLEWAEKGPKHGCLAVYHGLRIEDNTTGYFIAVWESLEQLRTAKSTPAYTDVAAAFRSVMVDGKPLTHRGFSMPGEYPQPSLEAPVTELVVLLPRDEKEGPKALADMGGVAAELDKPGTGTYAPCEWGPSVDEPSICAMTCGWESMEVHKETVSKPPFSTLIGKVAEIADIVYGHSKMVKIE